MAAIAPPLETSHERPLASLASVPSIILSHLRLEHLIPVFSDAQIDIFRLLMMKDAADLYSVGVHDTDDCRRLSQCVRSIHAHMSYKGLTVIASAAPDALPSPSSSNSLDISALTAASEEEQQCIVRAIEAFDRHALPSLYASAYNRTWSPPTTPPLSKFDNNNNKGKVSVRSSFLSTFSDSTLTAPTLDDDNNEDELAACHHSESLKPPPYEHNNNAITPKQQTVREGRPGLVVPRQPRNLISRASRPLSMPAYLMMKSHADDDRPASPTSTIVSPPALPSPPPPPPQHRRSLMVLSSAPPDYLDTALMKRWEKHRSCIIPREEEGREELPPYKCTVYKMGHVHIKRELDSPGVRTRWRSWRKLYVEVWGTMLRVYRASPHSEGSSRYKLLSRQPLLATRLPLSQWSRYYYSPLATISLAGAEAGRAWDYTKRPFVLRLTTVHGPQMLLRLASHVEMISWVEHLQAAINISLDLEQRPMPKFMTLPSRAALSGSTMSARAVDIERARERRRREQREMLL